MESIAAGAGVTRFAECVSQHLLYVLVFAPLL